MSEVTRLKPAPQVLGSLLQFRYLIRELAFTDFKLKYQGSVLGYAWSLAKPLLLFAVLYVVFTRFIRIGGTVPHYAVYLLLGIVLWSYFADSTSVAMNSIVERGDLIRKVWFPRIVIPIAASVTSILTLLLNLLVIFVFILVSGVGFRLSDLLFVPLLLELYVLSLGSSLLLAALFVKFRDFRHIWELGLQMLFYASPIIYPLSFIPASVRPVLALNPIGQIVEDARRALIDPNTMSSGEIVHWPLLLIPYLIPLVLLAVGYWYFESAAARFAEEL
jgi:ABC-2 type transport system permease protein